MGWFSDFVSNPIGTLGETGQKIITTVEEHPVETALIATGAYYGPEMFAAYESGTALTVTEAGGAEALSGIDLGGLGASPASWTNATTATMAGNATSGWTAGQVASTVSSGLNLATSATKLSLLGKSMDAQSATANGLTGALAPSPIQTPSGLITTTPQGPLMVGNQAASGGFMGMDTQTLFVIAAGIAAVYYFAKHGK
jgi:hypothetical protein